MQQHKAYQLVASEDGGQWWRWRWAVLSLAAVLVMAGSLTLLGCSDENSDAPGQRRGSLSAVRAPINSLNAAAMVGRTFSIDGRAFNSENAPLPVDVTFLTAPTTITTPATATVAGLLTGGTFRVVRVDGATATGTWAVTIPPTNAAIPVAAGLHFTVATAAGGTSTFPAGTGLGRNEGAACTSTTFCFLAITAGAPCDGTTEDRAASIGLVFGPQALVAGAIPGVTVGGTVVVTSSPLTNVSQTAAPLTVPMVIDANGTVFVSAGHIDTGADAECR